jgi:hypothetical protein
MKQIGKMLAVILGGGLLVVVGAMVGPRAAQAIVATLVQVTNTSSNPVPVTLAPTKTVTVANINRDLQCGSTDDEGPFDVSSFSTIRFIAVTTFAFEGGAISQDNVQFQINGIDSAGNPFPLDTLTATGPFLIGGTVPVSGVYQAPGNSVQVHITPGCQTDEVVHLTILGR